MIVNKFNELSATYDDRAIFLIEVLYKYNYNFVCLFINLSTKVKSNY